MNINSCNTTNVNITKSSSNNQITSEENEKKRRGIEDLMSLEYETENRKHAKNK